MDKWMTDPSVILRAEVGSRLYGTNLGDSGDRDELGIRVESFKEIAGFTEFEQDVWRTAEIREGVHDAPSQAGDLDLTIYGLRKFLRLALKGNPTIIQLLFVPRERWVQGNDIGRALQDLAPSIVSRAAGGAFLGYLQAQRMRFIGERGGSHGKVHEEDYEKFGYDTKYAMHMLRLGFQGVELLTTGKLTFPVPERDFLLRVRTGGSDPQEILTRTGELEREIKDLLDTSPLPRYGDQAGVEAWMLGIYDEVWRGNIEWLKLND